MTASATQVITAMHNFMQKENLKKMVIKFTPLLESPYRIILVVLVIKILSPVFIWHPEQIQFLLSRVTAGFPEFEWSQSKIFGVPDGNGYSTAQQFFISRHVYNNQQEILTSPWRIQINNGKGIKKKNHNGGTYMQAQSFISEKSAFIQLTDMDFYMLLKRADSYIVNWENYVASFLIQNGKQQLKKQQEARMAQNIQPQPDEMTSYMQGQPQEQYLNGMYVA